MTAPSYFIDTSVFACALGGAHPERAAARQIVEQATSGSIVLHASVDMVQELLHHRMRRTDRPSAVRQARAAGELPPGSLASRSTRSPDRAIRSASAACPVSSNDGGGRPGPWQGRPDVDGGVHPRLPVAAITTAT